MVASEPDEVELSLVEDAGAVISGASLVIQSFVVFPRIIGLMVVHP